MGGSDVRAVYKWIWTLVVVAVVCQVGFAAYGAFDAAHKVDDSTSDPKTITSDQFEHGFGLHFFGAVVIIALALALLIVSLIGGYGRFRLGRAGVLALLIVLQVVLAGIAFAVPAIGFLHAVNALVIFSFAGWTARAEWLASRATGPGSAVEPAAA
jgi:hypothetical protein